MINCMITPYNLRFTVLFFFYICFALLMKIQSVEPVWLLNLSCSVICLTTVVVFFTLRAEGASAIVPQQYWKRMFLKPFCVAAPIKCITSTCLSPLYQPLSSVLHAFLLLLLVFILSLLLLHLATSALVPL